MTRPASRRATTAWAAGLAGVAALLVAPVPAQAGASPSPSVPQPTTPSTPEGEPDATTPREPLRVQIDRLTPGEVPERGPVRVAGTVRNRSDEPWRNLQVYFLRSTEPITDVAALAAAADGSCVDVGTRVIDPFVEVPDLEPGESGRFRLEVPRSALGLSGAPGVYEVGVHVLGENAAGRAEGADGRACTFLPLVPADTGTTLALGIQLRNHTVRAPDGALEFLPGWEETFSTGRLRRLVELGSSAGGRPLTWVVDPALVDSALSVARGNPRVGLAPPGGDTEDGPDPEGGEGEGDADDGGDGGDDDGSEDPPAGDEPAPDATPEQAAASDWLATVTDELATSPVLALPYGDLDAASVVHRGLPEQLAVAQAASTEVLEDRDVSSTPALVPPSGFFPGDALAEVAPTTTVALLAEALPETVTVPVVERRDGGRLLVVPAAEDIRGPGPSARRSALAVRQRLLADAALHALSEQRDQPMVRLLPPRWDPGPAWRRARFFRGLDVPWLAAGGLAQAVSAQLAGDADPVGPRQLVYSDAEADAELPFAAVSASSRLAASGRTLDQLLTENDVVDQALTRQGLLSASVWSRRRPGLAAERAEAAEERVERWLSRISVRGPSFVTMSGDAGTFDVTVVNGLDQPVAVGLRATVPNGRLSLSTPDAVELPPRGRGAMRIDASATDIGIHLVTLQPITADGVEVGEVTRLSIRSSRVGLILWIVMGAAGALLFVLVAVRIVRRVRQRRRTHGPLLKAGAR